MSRTHENGFTLVEVLAALALASMVLVALNLAMTAIRQGSERAGRSLGAQAALGAAVSLFQRDVAAIVKLPRSASGAAAGEVFQGSAREMVYPMVERQGAGAGGLYLVRLSVSGKDGTILLRRERKPLLPGTSVEADSGPWKDPVVLLEGPYTLAFAYRAPATGSRSWVDSWPAPGPLPGQVRLTIEDEPTGRLRLPVIVQPVLTDAILNPPAPEAKP